MSYTQAPSEINLKGHIVDFSPATSPVEDGYTSVQFDGDGNLQTRGSILTDEGTFRVNFANSSLAVSIGTCTFTNGSKTVTGSSFGTYDLKIGDYVKLTVDSDSALTQIEAITEETLTLASNYSGTGGTGASSRQIVKHKVGSGATVTVSGGQCVIAAGTTLSAYTMVNRMVDVSPLIFRTAVAVSQRIINQTIDIGFQEDAQAPKYYANFRLDGTTNTTVKCRTARNPTTAPSGNEIQETVVTIPNGGNTSQSIDYKIELVDETIVFIINGVTVASHSKSLPSPYDLMNVGIYVENGGTAPASNTNVTCDFMNCKNHNKIEIAIMSDNESIITSASPVQEFTYSNTGAITINTDLLVIDCNQLRELSINCLSMGTSGVVTVQWCNNSDFSVVSTGLFSLSTTGAGATTFNTSGIYTSPVYARYCRLRLTTAATIGTTSIKVAAFQTANTKSVSINNTVPVTVSSGTVTTVTTVGTVTTMSNASLNSAAVIDIASAAITSTATSAAIPQTNIQSGSFNVAVTVASGTNPTMDIVIQESLDGTNWKDIYHFERITATGFYTSPILRITGQSVRYVRTITGTTPSFTMSLVRVQRAVYPSVASYCFYNRTIDPNTLNSTTPSFYCGGATQLTVFASMAGAQSSDASFVTEFSQDGTNWFTIAAPVSCPASANTLILNSPINSKLVRVKTTTAGVTQTLNYINIQCN